MEFYGQMKQGTATTLSALRDYIFFNLHSAWDSRQDDIMTKDL